jgi:PAS domain-containing protein
MPSGCVIIKEKKVFFRQSSDKRNGNDSSNADVAGNSNKPGEGTDRSRESRPTIVVMSGLSKKAVNYLAGDFDFQKTRNAMGKEENQRSKPENDGPPKREERVSKAKNHAAPKEEELTLKPEVNDLGEFDIEVSLAESIFNNVAAEPTLEEIEEITALKIRLEEKERDTEALKQDKLELLEKQRLLSAFFQTFERAMMIVSPNSLQINEINAAAVRLFGKWGTQLKGTSLKSLLAPESRAAFDNFLVSLLSKPDAGVEIELYTPEKGNTRVRITGTIFRHNAKIQGILLQLM